MHTWEDVVDIAQRLPEVEVSTSYNTPALKVGGKGFARLRSEAEGGLMLLCIVDCTKSEGSRASAVPVGWARVHGRSSQTVDKGTRQHNHRLILLVSEALGPL